MPTRTIEIPEKLDSFITASIASGHYENADAVVKTALELLAEEEENNSYKLYELRRAIAEGDASEDVEGDVFEQVRAELGLLARRA